MRGRCCSVELGGLRGGRARFDRGIQEVLLHFSVVSRQWWIVEVTVPYLVTKSGMIGACRGSRRPAANWTAGRKERPMYSSMFCSHTGSMLVQTDHGFL